MGKKEEKKDKNNSGGVCVCVYQNVSKFFGALTHTEYRYLCTCVCMYGRGR